MPVVGRTANPPRVAVELRVAVPSTVAVVVSVKVTVPVGAKVPGPAPLRPIRVKLNWTELPEEIFVELVARVPIMVAGLMVTVTGVAVRVLKLPSPAYVAPNT